jgi:hypothetical protein
VRLLLDEHLSPAIAAALRGHGHDAEAVAERSELRGLADDLIWAIARTEGRTVVTMDAADFLRLAASDMATGTSHAGLVLLAPGRFSPGADDIGRIVAALAALPATAGDGPAGSVTWLEPAPG